MKTEDLFEVYLGELSGIEDCSVEENARLLAEIRAGSREARNRLIEGNLKRAMFFVQDYVNQGVPVSDLIQEASLELMLLADEGFEDAFEGLLESRIRVRMEEVIREQKADTDTKEEVLARVNVLQEVMEWNIFNWEAHYKMAEEIFRLQPDIDGIFGGDLAALACLNAAQRRGLRVPEDISIVGFDAMAPTSMVYPQLTAVRQNVELLAEVSVNTLLDMVEQRKNVPHRLILDVDLQRGGTA